MRMKTLTHVIDSLDLRTLHPGSCVDDKAHLFLTELFARTEIFARDNDPSPFILARPGWDSRPELTLSEYEAWKQNAPREKYSITAKGVTYTLHIFQDCTAIVSFMDEDYSRKIIPTAFSLSANLTPTRKIHGIGFDSYLDLPNEVLMIAHKADGGCCRSPLIKTPVKQGANARKIRALWRSCVRRDLPKIAAAFREAPNLARDFRSMDKWHREDLAIPSFAAVYTISEDQRKMVRALLQKCAQYVAFKDPAYTFLNFEMNGGLIDGCGDFKSSCISGDFYKAKDLDCPPTDMIRWLDHVLCKEEFFLPNDAKIFFENHSQRSVFSATNESTGYEKPASAHEAIEIQMEVERLMAKYPIPAGHCSA